MRSSSAARCSTSRAAGAAGTRWTSRWSSSRTTRRRTGLTTRRSRSSPTGSRRRFEQAKALAGDKVVGVNGGTIASQCLNAGLLDEVWIDLVPVLLGDGTPFFDGLTGAPVELDGPLSVTEGVDVTHLRYRVRYS